jgi:hypothetical protein
MNQISIFVSIVVLSISSTFCSSQKEITTKPPQKIESVYYQGWIAGQEMGGRGFNVFLKFENQLDAKFALKKMYFQDKVINLETSNTTLFVARFFEKPPNPNSISDENAESTIKKTIPKLCVGLKPNEAIVEYTENNTIKHFKLENIEEKELLAYPSTRPRN